MVFFSLTGAKILIKSLKIQPIVNLLTSCVDNIQPV